MQFKLYKLIALLNIIDKRLEKIIVLRLFYLVKQYRLLLIEYTKERKLIFFENILHIVVKAIYNF